MSDFVTILQSASKGRRFAKTFNDGVSQPPKFPTWHRNGQVTIKNLKQFYKKVYRKYATAPDCCILRDKCIPNTEDESLCRTIRGKQQVRRKRGNFKDIGHNWVMFDIDKAETKVDWVKKPEKAVHDVIKTYLPEEFHDVQFLWAYSGSQGLGKEGINVHVVFWMERKVTNAEWRGWFKYHEFESDDPVDQSVFRPNQIHIIADPKLINTKNPFRRTSRHGFREKGKEVAPFNCDISYVDTPKPRAEVGGSIFDTVRGFSKPQHVKTFNELVDAHELLTYYGYTLAAGDPYGLPADEDTQCRYLHPRSDSGSPGTGLMLNGEIHSFADNDLLNIGRYVDLWDAYIILESAVILAERGDETEEEVEEFDINDTEVGDMEDDEMQAMLEGMDETDDIRRLAPVAILAESRARKLNIAAGLQYMHKRYFTLDMQHNLSLFKYIDLGEKAGGWRLAFEMKEKYTAAMSRYLFPNPRIEFVDGQGGGWTFSGGVKDIVKLYHADPHKRTYATTGIFFNKGPANVFDMWRGYSVKPREGDCKIFLDHLKYIVCDGNQFHYDYLLDIFAGWFQQPETRWGVVPVFVGGEGTGKGSVMKVIMSLYDTSNVMQTSDLQKVLGRFNLGLANKVIVFLDDISFEKSGANSDRSGKLKTLITEDTIEVEPKGQEGFKVPNCVHIGIASNDREKAVPATADSRRYFIVEVSGNKASDVDYFESFYEAVEGETFKAALLQFFMERKITHNLRQAPKTDKLMDMAVKRVDHVTQWLIEMCEENSPIPYHEFQDAGEQSIKLGGEVNKDMVWESYQAFTEQQNVRTEILTKSSLGKKLTEMKFHSVRRRTSTYSGYFYVTPTREELTSLLKYKTPDQVLQEDNRRAEEFLLSLE